VVEKDPQQMFRLDEINLWTYFMGLSTSARVSPGKRHPDCDRLLKTVVDTAGGRAYNAANLYIVLDRIVKPHI
jgi:hypothetical protein